MAAITADSLVKTYSGRPALNCVSFQVGEGEVFGFLGPNGSGKTTTIKILTTLITPNSGSAEVLGYDILSQAHEIRRRIGVVQQQESYELNLSVEKCLDLYGLMWDVPRSVRREMVEELLERFGLREVRKVRAGELSVGMRRRLQVAREFIHDMELLFLDEPTIGLDPIARRETLNFIKKKAQEGLTIFFTTHILEEAEYLCNRLAMINNGRIVVIDTPSNLKRRFGGIRRVEMRVKGVLPADLISRIESADSVDVVTLVDQHTMTAVTANPGDVIPHMLRLAERFGIDVVSIYASEPTLDDVFIELMRGGG
ncbi:MAG: ABC transporter ATP-binding protein [Nitrososphaerota archaeon]